ncbi:TniB family NTP-binding protein [Cryobacterium sp. 10S3]|uniref:TniB family NTP-binding protein n=1 Tax=Cryobacterium sp. 10S3 TaxID=3048582 RepID=UPI002AC911C5|nr:TniB family NTP-binding protein [Cryobacterium sp. 10S3]MEB0286736.1 TniB family NTP-binding protein [Cryobacterium sp. 10S3]WPX13146.1 TniB family NTP-binding protein [Cryobacterium sp. 10S3]
MTPEARATLNEKRFDYISADIVINTPQLKNVALTVQRAVVTNRSKTSGRFGVMISGAGTSGKTTAAIAAMRHIHARYTAEVPDFASRDLVPIVYIEVPTGAGGRAVMIRFAYFLGLPTRRIDTLETLSNMIVMHLNALGTKLVVVDEVHNLAKHSPSNGEGVDVLKSLSNRISATFVYAGINIHRGNLLAGERGEQITGRFTLTKIEPYLTANPAQKAEWDGIVRAFEREISLYNHRPGDLQLICEELHALTRGSIASLGRILTWATEELLQFHIEPEQEKITQDLLSRVPDDIRTSNESELHS